MTEILTEFGVIVLLILANGIFAGAELAVVSVRKTRLEQLLSDGKRSSRALLSLKSHTERFLATVQIGITFVSVTAAAFGGAETAALITPFVAKATGFDRHAHDVALALVICAISYLSIVVGELVPKSLALRGAETYALLVAKPLVVIAWLARPLVWFLTASSNFLLLPFRARGEIGETKYSADELQQLVNEAAKAGTVNPEVGAIASRALEFAELKAKDVMIPRQEVVLLPRRANVAEVQRILLERTHTRMPVFEGDIDNIVGYINVKDILSVAWDPRLFILEDLLRPAYFVPESLGVLDLLREMKERHMPFAIVVDEQGTMSGIVTMEDLLEELVGEIFSEHTHRVPELIKKEPTGSALVSGTAAVREVNRELELELPESNDYSTLAGLCIALFGRIPITGEKIVVPDQAVLEIVDASPRRVRTVRIARSAQGADAQVGQAS